MPYLICKKCQGYYELQRGESIEDFEECECGGSLKQVKSLDIPFNNERVKTIIETFKDDYVLKKEPKHVKETPKLSINVDHADGINRLLEEDKTLKKDPDAGLQRDTFREVALIPELYTFDYIDSLDDDTKSKVIEIIAEVVGEGKGVIDATTKILSQTSLNYNDAMHISRNEISRIKNLGNWYIHKEKGYNYFKVSKSFNACEKCNKTYNNTFSIEEMEMLPPLHDLCKCNAIFYKQ